MLGLLVICGAAIFVIGLGAAIAIGVIKGDPMSDSLPWSARLCLWAAFAGGALEIVSCLVIFITRNP